MKIFDLHCDTIEALKKHNETFDNSTTQFTMKGQENLEKAVQFLAVWLPDHLRGQEAVDFTNGYYEYMTEAVGKVADRAALVEDMSDLDRILKEGKWAFIRSIESGAALGGKLENVDHFAKLNFKEPERIWESYPFEMSGGMNQRAGIAISMLMNPPVLFADEPASALDVAVQRQVVQEMLRVRELFGTAIIIVTHDIGVVSAMADTVLVLQNGNRMEYGPAKSVLEHPRNEYTKELLSAVPKLRRS